MALPLAAQTARPAADAAPAYPNNFAGNPEFITTAGKGSAGTASIVTLPGGTQSYIVSVRHLLGPDGAFDEQTAAADVPHFVQSIRIYAYSGSVRTYRVSGLLVPARQLRAGGNEPVDDLAIYLNRDHSPQAQALSLAAALPAVGSEVWLIAEVRGGVPKGQVTHRGQVTSNQKWIVFRFDNDRIITAGASGGPVLNLAGEVVGVYSGHTPAQGHVYGYAIPAPFIAATIRAATPAAR